MQAQRKATKRDYHAPQREAAAARTREAIVEAALDLFEHHGWSATTLPAVAAVAGISPKTIEAIYKTKAGLLQATVEFAMRGDTAPIAIPQREAVARMEAAADASTMLELHAAHVRRVIERSAAIAWTVEHAAGSGGQPAALWAQMTSNRASGVSWATETLLGKPDTAHLDRSQTETVFWVTVNWGTYRTLTRDAGLDGAQYERWLRTYYQQMLVAPARG